MSEESFSAVTRAIEMTAVQSPVVAADRIEVRRILMPAGVAASVRLQCADLLVRHAQQSGEHLVGVLAQIRADTADG